MKRRDLLRAATIAPILMNQEMNAADPVPQPPVAKTIPKEITQHGQTRTDNYFWLRDGDRKDIIQHLEAENAYAAAMLKSAEEPQQKLYTEMLARIQQTDQSAPLPIDEFEYYSRTEEGLQYPIYCRRAKGQEQVLLNLNELAKTEKYMRLGNYAISPDHKLLAYSIDTSGDEVYTTFVKNLGSGKLLPDRIRNAYYGLQWTNDNRSFVYTTLDDAKRPYRAWQHTLGATDEKLLYEEKDERFHLTLRKSRSKRFLFIQLDSAATSEVWFMDAADGTTTTPRRFDERRHDIEYNVEHHGDLFYIRTTDGGRNYRVMTAPVSNIARTNWKEWIAHRDDVLIEAVDPFANHIVLTERDRGILKLQVRKLSGESHTIAMPEPAYTLLPSDNPVFQTNIFRFNYTSLVTPMSTYAYNMDTRERKLVKQQPVIGYDPSKYETVRIHATSHDGVKVPLSVVYRRDVKRNGKNPTLLYGYGSYGISIDPSFSSERVSLLDRGFVYAIGHIRGGSDVGKKWHDDGKLKNKRNTFEDFIACAKHLIAEKYTSADKLAIMGGSAGGLLMGAVINMRPDLFKAVVAKVPFVDVLNTATDPSLPLTVVEYDEWGNSNYKEFWEYIKSYSPYDNIERQSYPNILVTAGLNDPRVSYWEPAKWVAKLRTMKKDKNLLLLKTNMAAGHGGASGRYEKLKETAFDFAFLLHVLGV